MCIEHKQYWQCCLTIDSRYIDPCPFANVGHKCDIVERVHPISGYCTDCRKSRNKVEDDIVTNPAYHRNDGYDRPWNPQKYKPVKSQPLKFPVGHGPSEPERGRTTARMSPIEPIEPTRRQEYSYYYTERPSTPSVSDYGSRKPGRRHYDKGYPEPKQVMDVRNFENVRSPDGVTYRVASPKTIKRLQRTGVLPSWDQLNQMQFSRLAR